MAEYTFEQGQLVERVSTGERFIFQQMCGGYVGVIGSFFDLTFLHGGDCRPVVDHTAEIAAKDARIAELEQQVAKLEARNERMTQYVDDACECCRCCECQEWNPECSILATKRHKGIDIVTGKQLRAAAEGE